MNTALHSFNEENTSQKKQQLSHKVLFLDYLEEEKLERKFYSKKDLCKLYGISKNTLAAYINRFKEKFEAIGYNKYKKKLSVKEFELLVSLIGSP